MQCNPYPLNLSLWFRMPSPACVCRVQHLPDTRTPLQEREQQAITQQPGVPEWLAAAKAHPPPQACEWDVFISYAGNSADKPFARALKALLERTGWDLRIYLDDDSLRPAGDGKLSLQGAMQSAAVAVVLFSAEYFERAATDAELRELSARHALNRVQLLPVFLRLSVEDCKRRLANILGPGALAPLDDVGLQSSVRSSLCSISGCLCRKCELAYRHPPSGRGKQPAARHAQDGARDAVAHCACAVRPAAEGLQRGCSLLCRWQ